MILADQHNRVVRYLRLSITGRCPMRCIYCRPAGQRADQSVEADILTPGEIERLVRVLVEEFGLAKVRLTGGEPTARRDLPEIIRRLRSIDGLHEIALTTNGLTLARQAGSLLDAGLSRVNVSLDSLDAGRFKVLTGVDGLHHVIEGIDRAIELGLVPLKLNAVIVRGENDRDLPDLVQFAADRGVEMRFIELMPMGPLADQWADRFLSEAQMRKHLALVVQSWTDIGHGTSPAKRYVAKLNNGEAVHIGFIAAMSCPFCANCDRIRITASGDYFPCLMDKPAANLLAAIRNGDRNGLCYLVREGLCGKQLVHPAQGLVQMTVMGG